MDISAYQHMNIRMSTRGKRPLRNLTPNDKVRAIQRIHNGETKASVSRDIGVPESTLRGWCKNEEKLRFMCRQIKGDKLNDISGMPPLEKRIKYEHSLDTSAIYALKQSLKAPSFEKIEINSKECLDETKNFKKSFDYSKPDTLTIPVPALFPTNIPTLQNSQFSMVPNISLMSLLTQNFINVNHPESGGSLNKVDWKPQLLRENAVHISPNFNLYNDQRRLVNTEPVHDENMDIVTKNLDKEALAQAEPSKGFSIDSNQKQSKASSNVLEWFKMFTASINFLALAAATASLQNSSKYSGASTKDASSSLDEQNYPLILNHQSSNPPTTKSERTANNESENYTIESEPEDLSVRCAAID